VIGVVRERVSGRAAKRNRWRVRCYACEVSGCPVGILVGSHVRPRPHAELLGTSTMAPRQGPDDDHSGAKTWHKVEASDA
jgi:hypothetical protein